MIRLSALIFCILVTFSTKAQDYWSPDSLSGRSPNYGMNRYNELLGYHDHIMYLTFPVIEPIVSRRVPLMDREGKDGYWLEGNFANRFIIHKGKYYNSKLLQRLRLTLDASLTPRLTRDFSSPLLPSNNKFGLGFDLLLTSLAGLNKERFTPAWLTIQMLHYSNGQADSFYIENEDGVKRNNYRSGDFSTNPLRMMFNLAHRSDKSIVSFGLGWQKEIDIKGPFGMSPELYNNYGKNRILFNFQWLIVSKLVLRSPIDISLRGNDSTRKVAKRRQFAFRSEMEYIVGDVSEFPLDGKYRLGWHAYLTYMPSLTNEVGFLIHTYTGRDYLNIRFDDIVFIAQAGLFVRINKK
jgi:hypothetical protein